MTLFKGLSDEITTSIVAEARQLEVQSKVQLCVEGERAAQLFLIKKGHVKYYRLTQDGKQAILFWFGPGDGFGFGTLLAEPDPYLASAESVSECQLLSWGHSAIRRLTLAHPQFACNAVGVVLRYLSRLGKRHLEIFGSSAQDRIAKTLLDLGKRSGEVKPDGVDLHITNEELASLADVSPYTVSRAIADWHRHGALTKQRKALRIHAPEKLVLHDDGPSSRYRSLRE